MSDIQRRFRLFVHRKVLTMFCLPTALHVTWHFMTKHGLKDPRRRLYLRGCLQIFPVLNKRNLKFHATRFNSQLWQRKDFWTFKRCCFEKVILMKNLVSALLPRKLSATTWKGQSSGWSLGFKIKKPTKNLCRNKDLGLIMQGWQFIAAEKINFYKQSGCDISSDSWWIFYFVE